MDVSGLRRDLGNAAGPFSRMEMPVAVRGFGKGNVKSGLQLICSRQGIRDYEIIEGKGLFSSVFSLVLRNVSRNQVLGLIAELERWES